MVKQKFHPRILAAEQSSKSTNFFYRLVTSQRFLAIVGLAFLFIVIFPLAKTYSQRRLVEKEIADVQKQIDDFESQNRNLKDMIAYLQSDQSLEEQARLNLNLKKPGEQVLVIEEKKPLVSGDDGSATTAPSSNLAKWWHYFFD